MLFEAPTRPSASAAVVSAAATVEAAGAVSAASDATIAATATLVPIPGKGPTPPAALLPPPPSPEETSDLLSDLVVNPALLARFTPTPSHYPSHPDLPWHTSWIDSDAMIGGCSVPFQRKHWRALRDMNVGLVVNLTESPISPPRRKHTKKSSAAIRAADTNACSVVDDSEMLFGTALDGNAPLVRDDDDSAMDPSFCRKCKHLHEECDADVFADVAESGEMDVLLLPVPDGSVPRFEQLEIFLREADATIKSGKRVMVHCRCGIGRTGTFLAIYLIHKYQMDPLSAVTVLRRYRPQSLQVHIIDCLTKPFKLNPPDEFKRNTFQERFVERWWYSMVKSKTLRANVSSASGSLAVFESTSGLGVGFGTNDTSFAAVTKNSTYSCAYQQPVPSGSSFAKSAAFLKEIDAELDLEFWRFSRERYMFLREPRSEQHTSSSSDTQKSPSDQHPPSSTKGVSQCVIAGPAKMPETRATARTFCYYCRSVIAVGPEKIALHPEWDPAAAYAVWPRVQPLPCSADFTASGNTSGGNSGYPSLVGYHTDPDEPATTSTAAELAGDVEALRLEEVQREVVSPADTNHAV
ncbi:hypothetical protein HDU84_003342 [Entophlyctis sp. JEL0112]|nr:hypothetical protein HDU84_003342 [Entophlyctis sp. JEL0112]